MKRVWITAALAGVCLLFTAAAPVEQNFARGETLDYTLEWVHITGGKARMTIAPYSVDPTKYRITSVASSTSGFSRIYKVKDELESIVERSNFSTTRYMKHIHEGSTRKDEITVIANGVATRKGKTYNVPSPVFVNAPPLADYWGQLIAPYANPYGGAALPYVPRGYTPQQVKGAYGLGSTTLNGSAYVRRTETIGTPMGEFKCLVVEPDMQGGGLYKDEDSKLTLWYSMDARHLPVRVRSDVKIGSITMTLSGARDGVTSTDPNSK